MHPARLAERGIGRPRCHRLAGSAPVCWFSGVSDQPATSLARGHEQHFGFGVVVYLGELVVEFGDYPAALLGVLEGVPFEDCDGNFVVGGDQHFEGLRNP